MEINREEALLILKGWEEDKALLEITFSSGDEQTAAVVRGFLVLREFAEGMVSMTGDPDGESHIVFGLGDIVSYWMDTADWDARRRQQPLSESLLYGETMVRVVFADATKLTFGTLSGKIVGTLS